MSHLGLPAENKKKLLTRRFTLVRPGSNKIKKK